MVTPQSPTTVKSAASTTKALPTSPFKDGRLTPDKNLVDATAYETAKTADVVKPTAVILGKLSQEQFDTIKKNDEQTTAAATEHKKTLAELLEEHFVRVDDLRATASNFPWRGHCEKCGWHTHQFDQTSALALTRLHVQSHWRDVTRFM